MGDNLVAGLIYAGFIIRCISVSRSGFLPKRKINGFLEKTVIYLFAEYSYKPNNINNLLELVKDHNHTPFRVPLSVTWAGAVKPQFEKMHNLSSMFTGLCVVSMMALAWSGNSFFKNTSLDLYNIGLVLLFIVVSFAYYFRSVASDLFSYEDKAEYIAELINRELYIDTDIDVIDEILNQIKIDLDIYKTNIGFGGILLILMSVLISFSNKTANSISPSVGISLILISVSTTIFKWMYDNYRTRIIQIAANALLIVKKIKLAEMRKTSISI